MRDDNGSSSGDWDGPKFDPLASCGDASDAGFDDQLADAADLSDELMERLALDEIDKEHLARLVEIVRSDEPQERKLAQLTREIGELGPVLIRVLRDELA